MSLKPNKHKHRAVHRSRSSRYGSASSSSSDYSYSAVMEQKISSPGLVFNILAHLQDNKSTLKTCSLVNRCWRDVAQRLLFETKKVKEPISKLANFLSNIRSHPRIPSYVHHLSIDCKPQNELRDPSRSEGYDLDPVSFDIILSALPCLERLELEHICWKNTMDVSFGELEVVAKPPLRTLKFLKLRHISFQKEDSLHGIWDILLRFNFINMLQLEWIPNNFVVEQPPPGTSANRVTIERVVIDGPIQADAIFSWLTHQPLVEPLQQLHVALYKAREFDHLASYLQDAGSNIRDLSLNMYSHVEDVAASTVVHSGLPIKSCCMLSSLRLKVLLYGMEPPPPAVVTPKCWQSPSLSPLRTFLCFGHLLSSAPTTLRHLHLVVHSFITDSWFEEFQNADWNATVDVINRITSLEDLHFQIRVWYRPGSITVNPNNTVSRAVSFVKKRFKSSPHKPVLRVSGEVVDDIVDWIFSLCDTSPAYVDRVV